MVGSGTVAVAVALPSTCVPTLSAVTRLLLNSKAVSAPMVKLLSGGRALAEFTRSVPAETLVPPA